MSKINQISNFTKGFIKENPVFVLFLGLCPTLGVTTSAINGMGMGLAISGSIGHCLGCGIWYETDPVKGGS